MLDVMEKWKETELRGYINIVNGFAFKSKSFLNCQTEGALPVVKIKNVANGDVNLTGVQYHLYEEKFLPFLIEEGDVLVALTGNHPDAKTQVVGAVSLYKMTERSLLNQRVAKIIPKQGISKEYLYYFLKDEETRNWLAQQSSGSANQANISKKDIEGIPILIPSLSEQLAIASVLSSLDDKIDLLHRQNATLEKMAETLFRQWFVEEAKEEWKEVSLYDAIELIGGGTPKTSVNEYWNGNIKWLSGGDIASNHKSIIVSSEKTITEKGLKNSSAKLLPKLTTVISARGTVGKYCILAESMAFSQSNYGIEPKHQGCYFFTYLLVNHSAAELNLAAYGSVFDTITINTFKGINIKIPSEGEIQEFENKVSPYFLKILNNQQQIQSLTSLRDTLLPKLMNGDVRVKV